MSIGFDTANSNPMIDIGQSQSIKSITQMGTKYVATEYVGDPPTPIARWYTVQAGTYARISPNGVEFMNPAELNTEMSTGTVIEFVVGDEKKAEIEAVNQAWSQQK